LTELLSAEHASRRIRFSGSSKPASEQYPEVIAEIADLGDSGRFTAPLGRVFRDFGEYSENTPPL